ncbi:BQ5605_C004g02831 [Microbotryum silenes-dioicae]|uniref:BQ5605_C004g02831 protein n=1 Tax=Microbotryum silenes-dioicae TaxID=796604 RepID=A0A2X0P4H0_9BASI|nr:BQ5605_C004g02831 [Microbotryum silenes-dioicae]
MRSSLVALFVAFACVSVSNAQTTTSVAAATSAAAASTSSTSSSPIPFFSAPTVGSALPTGQAPIPGAVTTIINSGGAGNLTDSFVYTVPVATVSPTGTVYSPASGTTGNLQPDPTHLQVVGATSSIKAPFGGSLLLSGSLLLGVAGGIYLL